MSDPNPGGQQPPVIHDANADRVSKNAMYVLFAMAAVFVSIVGLFVYMLVSLDFSKFTMELFAVVVGVFSGAIGVLGTIIGTLIQNLWGK